jgi:hypothetical protein
VGRVAVQRLRRSGGFGGSAVRGAGAVGATLFEISAKVILNVEAGQAI